MAQNRSRSVLPREIPARFSCSHAGNSAGGRILLSPPRFFAAHQRHEAAAGKFALLRLARYFANCLQRLRFAGAQRNDKNAPFGQLLEQRWRQSLGGGGHDDPIVRRIFAPAVRAVAHDAA